MVQSIFFLMGSLKSYPFAVHSLHFSQDSVSFCFPCYRFKSEQLSEGATNGRPQEEEKAAGRWGGGRGCCSCDGAERKVKRSGNKRVTCRPLLAVFCVSMVVDLSGFLMLSFRNPKFKSLMRGGKSVFGVNKSIAWVGWALTNLKLDSSSRAPRG